MVTASHVDNTQVVTAVWAVGAQDADAEVTLPAYYPEIDMVLGGARSRLTYVDGTSADTIVNQALTAVVYAATIADNTITKVSNNSIRVGNALLANDLLTVVYRSI